MGDAMTEKWGWMRLDSEEADGPYATREAALAAAQADVDENLGEESVVVLGHCDFLVPADYVPDDDMEVVLFRMDECARAATMLDQDDLFTGKDGAQEAFTAVMIAWAREWVTTDAWEFDEVERITLRQGGKP